MSNRDASANPQWNIHLALASWLAPGLGHILLGQKKRGYVLMAAILGLWLGGILIGGISVVDRHDRGESMGAQPQPARSWWFFGQAMIAPSIVVDRLRDRMAHAYADELGRQSTVPGGLDNGAYQQTTRGSAAPTDPRDELQRKGPGGPVQPPYEPSLARVAEQGTLYTALAGLLNLLAIIDVLYCDPAARRKADRLRPPAAQPAAVAEAGS